MSNYIASGEQLVVEFYVRDLAASRAFYESLGFRVVRVEEDFLELQWEDSLLFLEVVENVPLPPAYPVGNIRIMVPNVDDYWALAQKLGTRVIRPLENRSYGLRDFTIAGPDGLGLRFASRLQSRT